MPAGSPFRYGVLDGQHRVQATRQLNFITGPFNVLHPKTPDQVVNVFGRRNTTTGAGVRETRRDQLWSVENQHRADYAIYARAAGKDAKEFRKYLRTLFQPLSDTTFEELYNLSELEPETKKMLLYVFRIPHIWF